MLDLEDITSLPEYSKLRPGDQTKIRALFFRKVIATRPDYRQSPLEEQQKIATETIFGPEEPKERPSLLARLGGNIQQEATLDLVPAPMPSPEGVVENLTGAAGQLIGGAIPYAAAAALGFPAGGALMSKLAGPVSRFVAPTFVRRAGEEGLKFGLTGLVHEAARGAAQQRSPTETGKAMVERFPAEMMTGALFGAATPKIPHFALEPPPSLEFGVEARRGFAEDEATQATRGPKLPPGGTGGVKVAPPPSDLSQPIFIKSPAGKDIRVEFESPVEKAAYLYHETANPELVGFIVQNVKMEPEQFVQSISPKVDQAVAVADRLGVSFGYVKAGGEIQAIPQAAPRPAPTPTRPKRATVGQPPPVMDLSVKQKEQRAKTSMRVAEEEVRRASIIKDANDILANPAASPYSKEAATQALKDIGAEGKPIPKNLVMPEAPEKTPQPISTTEPPVFETVAKQKRTTQAEMALMLQGIQRETDGETLRLIIKQKNPATVKEAAKNRLIYLQAERDLEIKAAGKSRPPEFPEEPPFDIPPEEPIRTAIPTRPLRPEEPTPTLKTTGTPEEAEAFIQERLKSLRASKMYGGFREEDLRVIAEQMLPREERIRGRPLTPEQHRRMTEPPKFEPDISLTKEGGAGELRAPSGKIIPDTPANRRRLGIPYEPVLSAEISLVDAKKIAKQFPLIRDVVETPSGFEPKFDAGTTLAKSEEVIAQMEAFRKAIAERGRAEPPRFEPTQAGMQGVLSETPQRKVPETGLKPKVQQTEKPTDLEATTYPESGEMFGAGKVKEYPGGYGLGPPSMGPEKPATKIREPGVKKVAGPVYARVTPEIILSLDQVKLGDTLYDVLLGYHGTVAHIYKRDIVRLRAGKDSWTASVGNRLRRSEIVEDILGPTTRGGDRITVEKTPALDAEIKKTFPVRGGAPTDPVTDPLFTNIRSEDIRMLPESVQRAILIDTPVPVNYADPGKLAGVKYKIGKAANFFGMPLEFIYRGSEAGEHLLAEMNGTAGKILGIKHYFLDSLANILRIVPETERRQVVGRLLDSDGARYVAQQLHIVNPTGGTPIPAPNMRTIARLMEAFRALDPEQRQLYARLRGWMDDAGRTVGFEPGVSFTDYLSRFRETIEKTTTFKVKVGEGEIPKTLQQSIPPKIRAYFEQPRATNAPADLPLEETLKIYSSALARRIATSGGFDPRAPDIPIEGFLSRINPALAKIPGDLQPFTRRVLEHFLGLGEGAGERSVGAELLKLIQFNRNMAPNLLSPIINHTQKMNTMGEVGFRAFVQGYRDMYDPQRVAIARAAGADIDIGPIMQELSRMRGQGAMGKALEGLQAITDVTGKLFRMSEASNQLHSFLSGLRRGEQMFGELNAEAVRYARDIQAGTQFGMPSTEILTFEKGPAARVFGQFKRFQINQWLYPTRLLSRDVADWRAGRYWSGTRTLGYLAAVTALVGADGIFPGLDDQIRKRTFEKWPGGLAGLAGVYLADRVGLGVEDSRDITRSMLFFLPGPTANNLIDAFSAARGVDFWTGRELQSAEIASKFTRSIPISGIVLDRVRRAWVESQGPLQPNTKLEAFGIYPPTGIKGEPRTSRDVAMIATGLPPAGIHEELEQKRARADVRLEAMRTLRNASDKFVGGEIASSNGSYNHAVELKSDAARMIEDFNQEHPRANLRLRGDNLKEARERRRFTPSERQRRAYPRSLRGIEEMQQPPVFEPMAAQ